MRIKFDNRDLLSLALLLCALMFFCYMATTAFPYKGVFDFPTFVSAAFDFEKSQVLYHDDKGYASNLSVYKFPPLFAAILVQGVRSGLDYEDFFVAAFWLHIVSYLASLFFIIAASFSLVSVNRRIAVVLFSIGLLFFPLLDHNIIRLQLDVYVLLLVSASLYFLSKKRNFSCGFLIGLAIALKLYPAVLLCCFLALGALEVIAGAAVGFLLAVFYSATIIGVDETMHFFATVLPVLMQELPAGNGDGNISFPTLFHTPVTLLYLMFDLGIFSEQEFLQYIESGKISMDVLLMRASEVSYVIKALTSLLLFVLMFVSFRIRKNVGQSCYVTVYSAFIIFNIMFMPNSWLNYQVVLVAPILVVVLYLLVDFEKHRKLLWMALLCLLALWCGSTLDALQERANHYYPDDVQIPVTEGLSLTGRWVRCMSAVLLVFVCLSFATKQTDQQKK
jgi:hypothetical protein